MNKKVILYIDESGSVHNSKGVYIGLTTFDDIEYYEEPASKVTSLDFIKAGVSPKDLIEMKRNDLI